MTEVRIFPIFDQSAPGVWDDLLRIRVAAMLHNYNVRLSDQQLAEALQEFQKSWKRLSFNYAFGAYDGDKMVGCISGDVQKRTAFVRHLYVLPECQGHHIGARLLSAAEHATSIVACKTDIVALVKAEQFYVHQGYSSPMGTNNYFKNLTAPKCLTVPVFHLVPAVTRASAGFYCDSASGMPSVEQVNSLHAPVFADYDVKSNLRALGVIRNGERIIASRLPAKLDFGYDEVNRAVNNYMIHHTR